MKHSGDARMRANLDPTKQEIETSLLESADSVLLYVYSFWCDDLLAGRTDEKGQYTKPGAMKENWSTLFGLLGFVRSKAEKAQMPLLAALLYVRVLADILDLIVALGTSWKR